jgi:Family of unknown function (DUF6152)
MHHNMTYSYGSAGECLMLARKIFVGLAAALAINVPTQAHHAVNAQFDLSRLVPLSGTLARLDNLNPHAYWRFDVKGANGKIERWNLESLAPAGLRRAGIMLKQDIKVGQIYSMKIAPSRNGSATGLLLVINLKGKDIRLAPI